MRFNEQQRYYMKNRERILAKAKKASRAKGIRSRDDAKAERAWKVHGSIWRLLAANGPMQVARIASTLGMTRMATYNNLYAMTGVKCVGQKWAALNVTEEWLEVLRVEGTATTMTEKPMRTQLERQWNRRMKIWHMLNNHAGLLPAEISKLTGIDKGQVFDDLKEMGGVRSERASAVSFRWYVQD